MPGLEQSISDIVSDFESLLEDIPEMRRDMHVELSGILGAELDSSISASLNDDSGKIAGWQQRVVGSGGGYAAVRPTKNPSGANGPGAITNYLEHGHKIRPPSGKASKYRPRVKVARVQGRFFFQRTGANIEAQAIAVAEAYCGKLAVRLDGGGG